MQEPRLLFKSRQFAGHHGLATTLDHKAISDEGEFEGYGAIFNKIDMGGDVIVPGAFTESLAKRPAARVKMLYQHNTDRPIGVWSDIAEDAKGLKVKGRLLLATTDGREAHELMKAGAIDGLSIGYRTLKDEIDRATSVRRIIKADLYEISPVTFPMNDAARIGAVKEGLPTEREFEDWLVRDAGFSRRAAKTIISSGYKSLPGARDAARDDHSGLVEAIERAANALK